MSNNDLISRSALYEKTAEWEAQALHMVELHLYDDDKSEWRKWSTVLTERSAFKFDIADAPAADVKPVGEWIDMATKLEQQAGRHDYRCSVCKERASNFVGGRDEWWDMWAPNFCPNCGADMRKEANNAD